MALKLAVSLCGILDLTEKKLLDTNFGYADGGTVISWLIGADITHQSQQWTDPSPLYHISKTAIPTYFIHGEKDEIVPYEQSVSACQRLRSFNIPSQLSLLAEVDHDLLSVDLTVQFEQIDNFIRDNIRD
jgi:dipeptidyl aminopeptidase/acylaminoacyl peptidase